VRELLHFQKRRQSPASAVTSVSPSCTVPVTAAEWPRKAWCGVGPFFVPSTLQATAIIRVTQAVTQSPGSLAPPPPCPCLDGHPPISEDRARHAIQSMAGRLAWKEKVHLLISQTLNSLS
jgi:hypothetical protein